MRMNSPETKLINYDICMPCDAVVARGRGPMWPTYSLHLSRKRHAALDTVCRRRSSRFRPSFFGEQKYNYPHRTNDGLIGLS
jgi:hypothetical protein